MYVAELGLVTEKEQFEILRQPRGESWAGILQGQTGFGSPYENPLEF